MKLGKNSGFNPQKPKKNLLVTIIIVVLISLFALGVFFTLKIAMAEESYYVLNTNVPARAKITTDMLQEVRVSKDGVPQNAIPIGAFEQQDIYTKIPLDAGDILTESNTGLSLDTSTGIPDDWVVTSINISSDKAVGGQIARGDYFDILGVNDMGETRYIAVNVLALDVKYSQSQTADAEGKQVFTEELQYIIGAPAEYAASIASATDSGILSLRAVLSPRSIRYKERDIASLEGVSFKSDSRTPLLDMFKGTDPSFTTVLRDKNGRPVNKEYCDEGLIEPADYCDKLKDLETQKGQESSGYQSDVNTDGMKSDGQQTESSKQKEESPKEEPKEEEGDENKKENKEKDK